MVPRNRLIRQFANDGFQITIIAIGFHLGGACIDLVINVGEISHIADRVMAIDMAQQPKQRIEHHHRARVAYVGAVIDRRPTDIHPHVRRVDRHEILFRAGLGVIQFDLGHSSFPVAEFPAAGLAF